MIGCPSWLTIPSCLRLCVNFCCEICRTASLLKLSLQSTHKAPVQKIPGQLLSGMHNCLFVQIQFRSQLPPQHNIVDQTIKTMNVVKMMVRLLHIRKVHNTNCPRKVYVHVGVILLFNQALRYREVIESVN